MTIVGKILVFINLVFSLVVGALVLFVYTARVNYVAELGKERVYRQLEKANGEAYKIEVEEVRAEMQARNDQVKSTLKRVQDELQAQQVTNKNLNDKLVAEEQKTVRAESLAKAAEVEVQRRQTDVETMRKTLKDEMTKNVELVKSNNSLKERTTAAEIQYTATLKRNRELENQLEVMARDNARIRANLGTTTTVSKPGSKNPPPENIEGLVKVADRDGLVKITLGSDAGLVRGHTLEVFRINANNPTLSKYLGTIRIIEVGATEAVGQPMGKMTSPVQPGDNVASRILGG